MNRFCSLVSFQTFLRQSERYFYYFDGFVSGSIVQCVKGPFLDIVRRIREWHLFFLLVLAWLSQASSDPSSPRLSLIHWLVQHATMVECPIRLQERCEIFIARVSANGSKPEHGPESVICCDGSHPVPLLFYHEARATSSCVWHRFWEGCFRCFANRLRQEPVLRVPADSVQPGVAGRRDIDTSLLSLLWQLLWKIR